MGTKSAEQAKRALAESLESIARLAPSQKDEGVTIFNVFRRGIMQASNGDDPKLDDLLGDLEPKIPVFDFLVNFHDQKRTYRKQVAAVWGVLLQVDSWLQALRSDEALCSKLPTELRSVLESAEGTSSSVEAANRITEAVVSSSAAPVSEAVGPSEDADLGKAMVTASTEALASAMALAEVDPSEAAVATSSAASAGVGAALATVEIEETQARPLHQPCVEAPDVQLQRPVVSDSENLPSLSENTEPTTFAVREAIGAALARVEAERRKSSPKPVYPPCREVASRPSYESQSREVPEDQLQNAVSSVLRCRRSVDLDEQVAAFEEFQKTVNRILKCGTEGVKALEEIEQKDQVIEFCLDVYESKKNHQNRIAASCRNLLNLRSWRQAIKNNGALDARLPAEFRAERSPSRWKGKMTECFAPDGSEDPKLQERASLVQHRSDKASSSGADAMLNKGIEEMQKLSFDASQLQFARAAFETFSEGVNLAKRTMPDCYADVLEPLEPKASVLRFLVALYNSDKSKRKAVRSVLSQLVDLTAWARVVEADERLRSMISDVLSVAPSKAARCSEAPVVSMNCFRRKDNDGSKTKPRKSDQPGGFSRLSLFSDRSGRSGDTWVSRTMAALDGIARSRDR